MDISKLVQRNIKKLMPYKAEELHCKIKLDANESPFCPDIEIPLSVFATVNRYPDPQAKELKKATARLHSVSVDNVLFGNGSDELIYYITATFGGTVLYPTPTFSMYGIIAEALGQSHQAVPLDRAFDIDLKATLSAIKTLKPKLIYLSSPNNPTGNCFSYDKIMQIIKASKGIVVIDEAYQAFSTQKSFVPLIKKHNNLIVLRTLSKVGLAGLRTGYMIASKEVVHEVNKVRLPFNLNIISQACATECLRNFKAFSPHINEIKKQRKFVYEALCKLRGIEAFPSDANFILFKVPNAPQLHRQLIKAGILVRLIHPTVTNALRVTIGSPTENQAFVSAITEILA